MTENTPQNISITAITPIQASRIFSAVYNRRISEDDVRQIAQAGGLLRADDTISLIDYAAFLAREVTRGGLD